MGLLLKSALLAAWARAWGHVARAEEQHCNEAEMGQARALDGLNRMIDEVEDRE